MHHILQICLYICMALTLCASVVFFFFNFLLNLLQYCFCFMSWSFGCQACGILSLPPGIEPIPAVLEGEFLTTRLPGKSPVTQCVLFWNLRTGYLLIISSFFFFLRASLVIQERLHIFLCFSLSFSDLSPVLFSSFYT